MIYVLVPAHNEAATVGLLLWKIRQLFTSFNREYQLIVVNDGSTDATDEILAPYTRALPLTLITHRNRQGYARSLEALLREAVKRTDRPRRDFAVTLQADFSESPEDVLDLLKKLEGGADIVIADRRNRVGASRTESWARRSPRRDGPRQARRGRRRRPGGTMRGYRLGVIERLVKEHGASPFLSHQGWAADLELLARVGRHARTIESVPVGGARAEASRPSRLRPMVEAWRAWRAASALEGLPRPVLAEGDVPVEQAERRDVTSRSHEGRDHGRRARTRGSRRRRAPRPASPRPVRAAGRRPRLAPIGQPQGPRKEKPAHPPRPPQAPAAETPPAAPVLHESTDAAAQPAAEGARKRRRRRGRGRGRGRGPGGPRPQDQSSLPAPPSPPPSAA